MGSLVLTRMNDAEYRAAIRLGNCIIAMAETIDAEEVIARTRTRRGPSLLSLGLKTAGLDDLEAARMIATSTGNLDVLGTALINAGANISDVGAFEEGLERIRQASAVSVELGLEGTWDRWLVGSAAQCAYWLGRWDEADHYLARAQSLELHGLPLAVSACVTASLAAHRRDDAGAIRAISEASDASPDVGYLAGLWRAVRAHTCLLRRDLEAAISAVDEGFDVLVGSDDLSNRAFLASLGAEAAADLAQRALARRDKAAAQSWAERASTYAGTAADLAAGRLVRGSVGTPLTRAHDASARAHAQRASGSTDPSVWETAIATYESIGAQPAAEWARYRLAEASLVLGDRESARAALRTAKDRASVIGDLALLAAIEVLARRGRVLLEASSTGRSSSVTEPPAPPNPWNLSNRETEVLGLVAEGLTNREIARQLFITEKTASSHVTHILDKLAVTSRTEAALLAARSGVLFMSGATLHATPEPNLAVHPSQD
jgi:DNA-binding CsgD family transcriptional regulator